MTDTDFLATLVREIATEAAGAALAGRGDGVEVVASKSTSVDVVTQVDRDVEQLIRSRIAQARPDDGFYGEESGAEAGTSGYTWLVDPIDGTVNFLYGLPHWCTSVAVVEGPPEPGRWRAVAGCVVAPVLGETFWAAAGRGAHLGPERLSITDVPDLEHSLVETGFGYAAAERARQGGIVAELLPRVRDIRRIGSAALALCAVAAGRVDAYFEANLNPWDFAAGALIAAEAGARVTGLQGEPPGARMVLAAPPSLVTDLESLIG